MSDYVAPFNTEAECDHEGLDNPEGLCYRCCPCDDCSEVRADSLAYEVAR